jgi:hypothetical protein
MFFQPGGPIIMIVAALVVVPFAVARGRRLGGSYGTRVLLVLVAALLAFIALIPIAGLFAVVPAAVAVSLVQWRRALSASVTADLVEDATVSPDDGHLADAIAPLRSAGFVPVAALRSTTRASPERHLVLLDGTGTTVARVFGRPGAARHEFVFSSSFSRGRRLVTLSRLFLPPPPDRLAQSFPGASPDVLAAEHEASLRWLADHGEVGLPVDATRTRALFTEERQLTSARVAPTGTVAWSVAARTYWLAVRRRSLCRGSVRDRPDAADRLAAWRSVDVPTGDASTGSAP